MILLAAALTLASGSPVADALSGRGARFLVLGLLVAPAVALIAVSPLGRLSGAHTNPAVTLAFWVLGRVSRQDLAGYVVAQFVGGVAGAALGRLVLPAAAAEAIAGAVTYPSVPASEAVAVEVAMTGALLSSSSPSSPTSGSRAERRWPSCPSSPRSFWLGSPLTGASLNPARSAGPAIVFGDLTDLWIHLLAPSGAAPLVGALWCVTPMEPKTAKVFHDSRYPCSLAAELPAMPV